MKRLIGMNTELRTKTKNDFEKVNEQFCIWKDYGEYKESQEYQAFDHWQKKKEVGVRA